MVEALLNICQKVEGPDPTKVVISEPYIPYVPKKWNEILVLAESQNLNHDEHVQYLKSLTRMDRMRRLYLEQDEVGVGPWDDGSLKLAVEAAFEVVAAETAVSNAVPWSQRTGSANANPEPALQNLSSVLWREMLDILKPKLVICSGDIAENVIKMTDSSGDKINIKKLRLPSAQALKSSVMFDENDLLRRYPEVKQVLDRHPKWGEGTPSEKRNKIFFACHAVSLHKGNAKNPSS